MSHYYARQYGENPCPGMQSDQNCLLSLPYYLGHEGRKFLFIPVHPVGTQSMFHIEKVKEGGMARKRTDHSMAAVDQASLPPRH